MAGPFGFEKDKYEVSLAVGELELLPAVRRATAETLIIADGFSCREQISQCTDRHALHLSEVIQMALKSSPSHITPAYPERERVQQREAVIRSSMMRAGSALAGIAVAGGLLWALSWKRHT
jgi:citrate lyase synthetase